jgi:hypothetical protein
MTTASRFGFLSDEERFAERGAAAAARVRRVMALDGTANLFSAANLLAQAHLQACRVDDAAEVSRHAIECAQRLAARPGRTSLLFHILRPQVTLLRIEGFAGDPDRALAGLAGLDDLAAGRAALVGDLKFDDDAIEAVRQAGYPLPALAGTVRMVDTCKILLRNGRDDELLAFAARYSSGLGGHAAEAPWLVRPLDLPPPDPYDLPGLPLDLARLGFAQAVHVAAAADPRAAGRIIRGLTQVRDLLNNGPWLSDLTPTRCVVSLAECASRVGLLGIVRTLALEARADAAGAGDQLLAREADALLKGLPRPDPASFDTAPADGPEGLDATTAALLDLLDEKGRTC